MMARHDAKNNIRPLQGIGTFGRKRYIGGQAETGEKFIGIASDGLKWLVYALENGAFDGPTGMNPLPALSDNRIFNARSAAKLTCGTSASSIGWQETRSNIQTGSSRH